MVKHVVCQKFADKKDAATAAEMLRALMGQVPSLRSMEVGLDYLGSESRICCARASDAG